jgi:hypothetical protein
VHHSTSSLQERSHVRGRFLFTHRRRRPCADLISATQGLRRPCAAHTLISQRVKTFDESISKQRARLIRAAAAVQERTGDAPLVEIMHPLVAFQEELHPADPTRYREPVAQ